MALYPAIDTELLRSFVAIVDHGGFTRAAEVVNRTQSAISMQMKRLEEDVLERRLFERDGRQVRLTAEGQVLLGYARRILKLNGEVMTTLREPHMVGSVRIGTPDDYVMRFLPGILSRFAQSYPMVQVEVHCEPSTQLLQRRDLDLSIVTRQPGDEIGQLLRQDRMLWVGAPGFDVQAQRPLPLAMFNEGCFCRAWACNALDAREIDHRIAYTSPSLAAILAVVGAGLAISAQMQSVIPPELRVLDAGANDLPELPSSSIVLLRNRSRTSPVSETMAEHIVEGFRL